MLTESANAEEEKNRKESKHKLASYSLIVMVAEKISSNLQLRYYLIGK